MGLCLNYYNPQTDEVVFGNKAVEQDDEGYVVALHGLLYGFKGLIWFYTNAAQSTDIL